MHPLFLQVARTQGMRELLAARVFHKLHNLGRRVRVEHDGVLRITIWLRRTSWIALGIVHLLIWWKVTLRIEAEMKSMKLDQPIKVKVR